MRWSVRALVVALAVLAPLLAFAGEKEVRLDVDGEVRGVRTYATSAVDLLERVGVPPEGRDLVVPDGAISEGQTVTLRRAKYVYLWLDDEPREVVVHGLVVADALTELGVTAGERDFVAPHPSVPLLDGTAIVVRNAVQTTVRADGRTREVVSSARTVGELLAGAGIELGSRDYVRPAAGTQPTGDMRIRVVRVRVSTVSKEVRIPFEHVERRDPDLERGVRRLAQRGAEGLEVRRYRVVLEDGERVSSEFLSEEVVRGPRDHIVLVGTKQPAFSGSGHREEGVASWFHAEGLVAAHRTLPIGTVVKVTDLANGRSVAVRVNQRGPHVDGRIIDLSDDAFQELAPLGTGTLRVRIEW
jgi:uncharacterized protein YabE (DUF348 family)